MSQDIDDGRVEKLRLYVYFNPAAKSEGKARVGNDCICMGIIFTIWINSWRNIYRELMRERVQKNRTCVILLRE